MDREAYAAARTVSPRVRAVFEHRRTEALHLGEGCLATVPAEEAIERIVDAAFWASLRREEGKVPTISLAFVSPEQARNPLLFERPLPLAPAALTRVAPAVERPGIHLGVWGGEHGLCVWGTTHTIPHLCLVIEVAAPGLLVIKHHGAGEIGKFANVAVLQGEEIKFIDETASHVTDCSTLVTSLLGRGSLFDWANSSGILTQLALSMRAHRHGGAMLIVPAGSEAWRESIVRPISYAATPAFDALAQLGAEEPRNGRKLAWREELAHTVDWIAGLTAVDGAVILDDRYTLLGFGAKIGRKRGSEHVAQVICTEPIQGSVPVTVHPEQLGGTRHLSAAQFVHDQRDAMALVASQDGRFTIFEWSPCEGMVHAHRVEALLL